MEVGARVAMMVANGLPLVAVAKATGLCASCVVQLLACPRVAGIVLMVEAQRHGVERKVNGALANHMHSDS